MKKSTIKSICTMLCVVMLAGFAFEAPLMADASAAAIAVNVGGKTVNVTPGQWVTVNNGNTTASYNVRYVNGKAVALDLQQYTSLVFGDSAASSVAGQVSQSASQASQSSQVAADSTAASQASGAKGTSGSWIKDELGSYGSKISDSYQAGKETGQSVGTKTVEGTKSLGSKIGNLLKSAKDKITGLFKKSTPAKGESKPSQSEKASQTNQSSEQSSQSSQSAQSEQASQTNQSSEQSSQASQSEQASQTNQSSEQSSQSSQSEQTSQASQQAAQTSKKGAVASGEKQGLFSKISGKVKSGYDAGKAMTNQGVQNVKDSLKSGFSAKNLLVTAGITVGVDLATQLMRGEDLSVKKALKTV
ncbi:MAG: hypothetical protein PHQ02_02805, partial [Candidatus Riflebacteria bacterium]|nr:hypothetical protein [Candidatus Riflebacteria bacterium]